MFIVCTGAEHNAHQDLAYLRMVLSKLLFYTDPDPEVGTANATAVRKTPPLFEPLYAQSYHFAKAGSGQTQGKLRKRRRFLQAEREAWRDLLGSLAAFPTVVASVKHLQPDGAANHNQTMTVTVNRTIFSEAEATITNSSNLTSLPAATRGSSYWHSNMGYPITHLAGIYPAAVVQRGDDPALVKVARATLLTAGECFPEATCKGWTPPNGYCLLWPGAGRLASREGSAGVRQTSLLRSHFRLTLDSL